MNFHQYCILEELEIQLGTVFEKNASSCICEVIILRGYYNPRFRNIFILPT
jgi:hypothetical protein